MTHRMKNGTVILCMLLLLCALVPALGESYRADTMRLLRCDGSVEILDVTGNPRFVLENVRFSSGETLRTGAAASASVSLDDTKIVSLDENSAVKFEKIDQHMELTLTEGTLFLDVSEKLDENESLDIRTSNMTVGIRGTIVFLTAQPLTDEADGTSSQSTVAGQRTVLGVLEGSAKLSYSDGAGERTLTVDAGEKAILSDQPALALPIADVQEITQEDLTQFVASQIGRDDSVRNRVEEACPQLLDQYLYTADGNWEFTSKVTLIAQSASKLYDGNPLTRTGDILVYGLPEEFGISAYAGGSRTDAGVSENPIASYTITNKFGDDITRHFTAVETVSGQLVVDPAPMTIWTGSATKAYDGTPLTNEEAGFDVISGQQREEPWRNTSLVLSEAEGETLYGVSGTTLVHGTNPLTEETREDVLSVGYKLTILLSDADNRDSISFKIDKVTEEELPEEVLRLYADNPELLSQACEDAGWDEQKIMDLIAQLPPAEGQTTEKDGLTVSVSVAGGLRRQLTNARINIDTEITDYNGRALSGEEAHFAEIRIDDSVKVTATGSQTEIGESQNTYEIDWGTENLSNFIISEDLGTLRVIDPLDSVTVTAGSAQKVYDGKPLSVKDTIVKGLPTGYSIEAEVEGKLTDAGSVSTVIKSYQVFDSNGEDVTEFYPDIKLMTGTLTIDPAPLTVSTGSAEKVYDGQALTSENATLSGLVDGETATAIATGVLTDAGSADNGYEIQWGSAKADNYAVTEELGTLTVEPLSLMIDWGSASADYSGSLYVPSPAVSYANGAHAGETVLGTRLRAMEIVYRYGLFTGDSLDLTITGSGTDAGSYTLTAKAGFSGDAANYTLPEEMTVLPLEIKPVPLTIATGSASRAYDGTPLTNGEVTVTGLQGGDSVSVTATGKQTDVGSSENGYTVEWGDVNPENYTLTEELGTLEVTANADAITFTAASAEKVYDGTALTDTSVTVSGLPTGFTYEAAVTGSQTDAGESDNVIESCKIYNSENVDVTANFTNITAVKGTLTVTPAEITVTTSSASKVYDGTALTGAASISGLTSADESRVTVTATGTQTYVGTADNTCTVNWNDINADNYTIIEELGTLTVDPLQINIDARHENGEDFPPYITFINGPHAGETVISVYTHKTGNLHSISNYYTFDLYTGDTPTVRMQRLKSSNEFSPSCSFSSSGSDRTNNYAVTYSNLEIYDLKTVYITTSSEEKVYDGTPLTGTATISGLYEEDESYVTVTATGTLTDAGSVTNTYTIDWGEVNSASYTVIEELGTLTVEKLQLNFSLSDVTMTYTTDLGSVPFPAVSLTYGNGAHAGETVSYTSRQYNGTATGAVTAEPFFYTLFTGDHVCQYVSGMGQDVGTYTITGACNGVSGYETNMSNFSASCNTAAWTVDPRALTITTGSASKVYDGTALTNDSVTVIGLTDLDAEKVSVTATGSITEIGTASNTYAIDWGSVNSSNYAITDELGTLTVNGPAVTLKVDLGNATYIYDKELHAGSPTIAYSNTGASIRQTGNSSFTIDFAEGYGSVGFNVGFCTSEAGTYTLTGPSGIYAVGSDVNLSDYSVTFVDGTMVIEPAKILVDLNGSAYDRVFGNEATAAEIAIPTFGNGAHAGESLVPHGPSTSVDETWQRSFGAIGSDNFTLSVKGWNDNSVGTHNLEPAVSSGSDGANYEFIFSNAAYTVSKAPVTITTGSAEKAYDGTALTSDTVSHTAFALNPRAIYTDADMPVITATGSQTEVGESINSYSIAWNGLDPNDYTVTDVLGTLKVTTAEVTITTSSASKVYDGTPLTGDIVITGLTDEDAGKIIAKTTGTITDVGETDNTYTIDWGDVDRNNYHITESLGKLTILPQVTVTVTTGSSSKSYDGTALKNNEQPYQGLKLLMKAK